MMHACSGWALVLFSTVLASLKHSQLFWRMFVYFAHCTGSGASRHSPLGWIALCKIYRPSIDLQLWPYHWLSALGFHSLMVSTSCPITSYGFDCSTAHLEEERTTSLPPKLLISFIRATCWFILIRSFILASQMFFYADYPWTELHTSSSRATDTRACENDMSKSQHACRLQERVLQDWHNCK